MTRQTPRGQPMQTREEAILAIRSLCGVVTEIAESSSTTNDDGASAPTSTTSLSSPLSCVYGEGPLVLSEIPLSCCVQDSNGGVVLGIDEAGRGSVVGPMVYGMAFWHSSSAAEEPSRIPKDFNDSKQLSDAQRTALFETLLSTPEIGFGARVLPASEISRNMLRRGTAPYNLNQMSHDATIGLIRSVVDDNRMRIQTCYIDTVGNPQSYTRRLEQEFPGIEFIVESKADDKYAPCSAASIVAKVVRDRMIETWTFSEPALNMPKNFGSGYPSDPACQAWMNENWTSLFGFADAVRFSWGPAKKLLVAQRAALVTYAADDERDEANGGDDAQHHIVLGKKRQQEQMSAFLSGTTKPKRLPYFESKKLHSVTKL